MSESKRTPKALNYILKDKTPIVETDILTWAKWFKTASRHVKQENIGDVSVSTVFLGLDHNFCETGEPILFETMIFGGEHDGYCDRYSTWEEAEKGHDTVVKMASKAKGEKQ